MRDDDICVEPDYAVHRSGAQAQSKVWTSLQTQGGNASGNDGLDRTNCCGDEVMGAIEQGPNLCEDVGQGYIMDGEKVFIVETLRVSLSGKASNSEMGEVRCGVQENCEKGDLQFKVRNLFSYDERRRYM